MMARSGSRLDSVRIASPCSVAWSEMSGHDRVRFCSHCSLHVYNISAMSRNEAEQLIERTEGRLCARFYQRADGTILTADCPVGLARVKASARRAAALVAFAFAYLLMLVTNLTPERGRKRSYMARIEPFRSMMMPGNAFGGACMGVVSTLPPPAKR